MTRFKIPTHYSVDVLGHIRERLTSLGRFTRHVRTETSLWKTDEALHSVEKALKARRPQLTYPDSALKSDRPRQMHTF